MVPLINPALINYTSKQCLQTTEIKHLFVYLDMNVSDSSPLLSDTAWVKHHHSTTSSHTHLATFVHRNRGSWQGEKSSQICYMLHSHPPGEGVGTVCCSAISSLYFSSFFWLLIGSFRPLCVHRRQAESILWNVMWKLLWSHASYINHQNDTLWKEAIALWRLLTIVSQKVI